MLRRRSNHTPDRYLGWKVGLFFAAAGMWAVGVAAEDSRLTSIAIVLAAAALLLRFAPQGHGDGHDEDAD